MAPPDPASSASASQPASSGTSSSNGNGTAGGSSSASSDPLAGIITQVSQNAPPPQAHRRRPPKQKSTKATSSSAAPNRTKTRSATGSSAAAGTGTGTGTSSTAPASSPGGGVGASSKREGEKEDESAGAGTGVDTAGDASSKSKSDPASSATGATSTAAPTSDAPDRRRGHDRNTTSGTGTTAADSASRRNGTTATTSDVRPKPKRRRGFTAVFVRFVTCASPNDVAEDEEEVAKKPKGRAGNDEKGAATAAALAGLEDGEGGQGSTESGEADRRTQGTSNTAVGPSPPSNKDKDESSKPVSDDTTSMTTTGTKPSKKRSLFARLRPPSPSSTDVPLSDLSSTASSGTVRARNPGTGAAIDGNLVADQSGQGVQLPRDETGDVTSGAVVNPGAGVDPRKRRSSRLSRGSREGSAGAAAAAAGGAAGEEDITSTSLGGTGMLMGESEVDSESDGEGSATEDDESESEKIIAKGGMGIPIDENGVERPLLVALDEEDTKYERKCLVLDLDETLVHSSFKQMVHQADFIVPVEIENQVHNVYVIKRPGVDLFLKKMGEIYEVVVFTASLAKYADPVLDMLDPDRVVKHRLFRESCYNHKGNYVKDLSQLGREIGTSIIIDNSPASYIFHPNNAVPISSWFNDSHDTELTDLIPFLTELAGTHIRDVRDVLDLASA